MLNISDNQCTGCKMCVDVCKKNAISFEFKSGFWYPVIDGSKCVECGMCEKMCPSLHKIDNNRQTPKVYAAWTKNAEQRIQCTSGGICYELSKAIIDNGGYVAGVEWGEGFRSAEYTIINDYDGLKRITQTKYFQADTSGIYSKVKRLLDLGETVMFIGTPCCNAALQRFLKKDYENLYNCEFVCRGISSPRVHLKRVEDGEAKHNSKIKYFHSKNKTKGWLCFGTRIEYENGDVSFEDRHTSRLTRLFTGKDMNTRPSCYNCNYREIPRYSDVTVGDFWGIENVKESDYFNGVSLFFVNSEKGKKLFDMIKSNIEYQERTVEEVKKGNPCLLNNPTRTQSADGFFADLEVMPFEDLLNKYLPKDNLPKIIKRKIKQVLRKLRHIKNILKKFSKYDLGKFIYYNYICKSVIRKKGCHLMPIKGTCIYIHKNGRLYLNDNFILNNHKMKGSKAESYLSVDDGAVLTVDGYAHFAHSSTITVNKGAKLTFNEIGGNYGTSIICSNEMLFKNDVMIGRDVTIFDSDYHDSGKKRKPKPVTIGEHVWIGAKAMIMKNVSIGDGAIIGASSVVTRRVKPHNMVFGNPAKILMDDVQWHQ